MIDRHESFSGYGPIRQGQEFDVKALETYMASNVKGFKGPIKVNQFKGGQSNPTYLITTDNKKYVLRRKPSGNLLKSAHAIDREYNIITALAKTDVPTAKTYALCTDESIIGTWFYIMEYMEGRIFWSYNKIPMKDRAEIYNSMNQAIANLHKVDYKALGLSNYGKSGNYFARQISRWSKQYEASKDRSYEITEKLIQWLKDNIPENDETTIVHGDFRLDNIVFHPKENRVIAILDWELSTLGHPLSDFSYTCMIWRFPNTFLDGLYGENLKKEGIPTEEEFIEMYCRRTGRSHIDNWNYYMAFNMFRLAAIVFGVKGRVRDGTASSDQAKATAEMAVPLSELGWRQVNR